MCKPTKLILQGNAALTNKLYQILSKEDGNVFFSPFGIHIVLSMVYQGSQEKTSEVLSQVLGLPDSKSTAQGFKELMDYLNSLKHITFLMANKIYAKKSEDREVKFIEEFEKTVVEQFYSQVEFADFKQVSESVEKINKWVAEKTRNNILEIVDESFITSETALFLINAIYFKGGWDTPFNENSTIKQNFYVDSKNTKLVEMMKDNKYCGYKYDEELDCSILSLDYKGNNLKMIIILPFENDGIEELEQKLANYDLIKIADGLQSTRVLVSLPKFKMEQTLDFKTVLLEVGLDNIFDKKRANFRKTIDLLPNEDLYLGKAIQKICIDVNEGGAEVAAVTVFTEEICTTSCRGPKKSKPLDFTVDHPAIFMLATSQNDSINILFYGRLSSPEV